MARENLNYNLQVSRRRNYLYLDCPEPKLRVVHLSLMLLQGGRPRSPLYFFYNPLHARSQSVLAH